MKDNYTIQASKPISLLDIMKENESERRLREMEEDREDIRKTYRR